MKNSKSTTIEIGPIEEGIKLYAVIIMLYLLAIFALEAKLFLLAIAPMLLVAALIPLMIQNAVSIWKALFNNSEK
tara:strand:- start:390 stop:614 length:225 start_codon:yes stop_codon:yes gene_type:complete